MPLLVLIGVWGLFALISWVMSAIDKANQYDRLKPRLDQIDSLEAKIKGEQAAWAKKISDDQVTWARQVAQDKEAISSIAKEKSLGFPWLANAYADYFQLKDLKVAQHLTLKSHPARKAADEVRRISTERRNAERLWRVLKYQLEYYETLFPFLIDFKGEDLDDLIKQLTQKKTEEVVIVEEDKDPARHWLTDSEYHSLPTNEKYQLALDRYWKKRKSKWEIGRDYERFLGYKYEAEGWEVRYQGIMEGLEDLGRDLVVTRGSTVKIVQCKYWSKEKVIHEKHVFQLLGTTIAYRLDNPGSTVSATLVTSTSLSEQAKRFATALEISVLENFPLESYPCIKCNISRRDGEKIYHLPFDQQYDRTIVEKEKLERFAWNVKEAEDLGFRRAYRWRGNDSQ